MRYAAYGAHSCELVTYLGRPIVGEEAELAYLFGRSAKIISVTDKDLADRSPLAPITVEEWLAEQGFADPFTRGGSNG